MGCANSRQGEDDEDAFFEDDDDEEYEEDDGDDDLDDLRSQTEDAPLVSIDRLGIDGVGPFIALEDGNTTTQQGRYQAANVTAPLALTASHDDTFAAALATSLGSSRRRWEDEDEATHDAPEKQPQHQHQPAQQQQPQPAPVPTKAQRPIAADAGQPAEAAGATSHPQTKKPMVFLTAGSAFKARGVSDGFSSLTPTVAALVEPPPAAAPPRGMSNPLAAPIQPSDQQQQHHPSTQPLQQPQQAWTGQSRSNSVGVVVTKASKGEQQRSAGLRLDDSPALSSAAASGSPRGLLPMDWDSPECIAVEAMLRRASHEQRRQWRALPPINPPTISRLTHPGLKMVEQWLAEVGATPEAVPSLVASPNGEQLINRRSLNSNDRIIRSIVERRRASVSSAQSNDTDENARRRSSARVRKPMESHDDDGGILTELAELQDQIEATDDDDEGDNSSKHTVRSEDGVLSLRPSSKVSAHHPAPRLSPSAVRANSRA